MKALGLRLRPPNYRAFRLLHSQVQEAPTIDRSQVQDCIPPITSAISLHLARKQPGAALDEFRKSIKASQSPDYLEQCIHSFGRHRQYEHMKKALSDFLDHGYSPSSELWAHVLHVAGLAVSAPTDIRPYFQQGLQAAINDEATLLSLIRYTARYGLIEVGEELFERYSERLKQQSLDSNPQPPPSFWAALIDGRARVADMDGAFSWFMRWRTSAVHPGFQSEDAQSLVDGTRNYTGRLAAVAPPLDPMRVIFAREEDGTTGMSTTSIATPDRPDPAPYLALLKHFAGPGSMPSLRLLELMAADGVPLVTATMNGLIDSEYKRKEKGQLVSILSLYDMMRRNPEPGCQPDFFTFHTVFKTYREPRQISSVANPSPKPTKLASMAQLPPPSEDLLHNPRVIFTDLCERHMSGRYSSGRPDLINTSMLEEAIGAFIRTRDFTGCAAALQLFKILRIEPTARLHAIVTLGLLRARKRHEAFHRRDEEFGVSDEEAARLERHIDHLNDLAGYEKPIIARAFRLKKSLSDTDHQSIVAIQNNLTEVRSRRDDFEIRRWNDRLVPRTANELRDTRRYELRFLSPLVDLLRRASGLDLLDWHAQVRGIQDKFEAALNSRGIMETYDVSQT